MTTKRLAWKRENVLKGAIPNKPGLYKFYSPSGRLLYTGHASRLRHRVQSYYQKDCPHTHRTKGQLRERIGSYQYSTMPVSKAKKIEKKLKRAAPFNYR